MFVSYRQLQRFVLLVSCIFSASLPSFGADAIVASPASFGEFQSAFIAKLKFPKHEDGSPILIKCGVMVHFGGKLSGAVCYSNNDFNIENRMRRVIVRATKRTRMVPATINGEEQIVWLNFSVIYANVGGSNTIEILENQLFDVEALGPHYVAAQRSLTKQDLFCFDPRELPISIMAKLSAEGRVTDLQITKDPQVNQCADEIEKLIRKSTFIPATVDGKAVASTYNEVFHHYRYDPY